MPTTHDIAYGMAGLIPYYKASEAKRVGVRLPNSVTYAKGTILGELIGGGEVQSAKITGDPTGGDFTLTFGGQTTTALAFDASAADVQAALEALSTIGAGNVSVIKARSIWTLTLAAGTDGGSFSVAVTIGDVTRVTTQLAWNVSAADMQTAIRALTNVGAGNATVTLAGEVYRVEFAPALGDVLVEIVNDSTNDGGVVEAGVTPAASAIGNYNVTFQNDLGHTNVAAMTASGAGLTGGSTPGVTISTVTAGSAGTSGQFKKCVLTATDGSQIPKGILEYDVVVDANGKITLGGQDGQADHFRKQLGVPMFIWGYFHTDDVPDMTEAMLALCGRMAHGTIANGGVFLLGTK